ncbi:MAG: PilZ domain-containing protein [Candidatus Sulfotelmatobacter sp.]
MQAVSFPTRQARAHYRHELRTLTYVTLDEANGGIIRDLTHDGVAVQAVAVLRPQQRVRLRFELRFPRLRVDACGQVCWASSSGQCVIRFADMPRRMQLRIDEWIFANLLEGIARDAARPRSVFGAPVVSIAREEDVCGENALEQNDGLILSPPPRAAIRLGPGFTERDQAQIPRWHCEQDAAERAYNSSPAQPNWLSQPLSGRTLAWLVDCLVVIAGLLLFALIFLSITHELPPWRLALAAASAAAVFIAVAYRSVFACFGGASLGARVAQAASGSEEQEESKGVSRFR